MVPWRTAESGVGPEMNLFRQPSKLRTFLVLGRVPNLPTVWSDCLAAWWLGGGGKAWTLVCVSISMSFIYEGGMFLNDAFDATFDRNHRRTRPIPSGAIKETEVWQWGFLWLILGVAGVAWLGTTTLVLALLLGLCVVAYDAIHKWTPLAPLLMGACRLGVYFVAASSASNGVTGEVIWKGLALAAYVAGLSWLARKESARAEINYLPCILLAAPILSLDAPMTAPGPGPGCCIRWYRQVGRFGRSAGAWAGVRDVGFTVSRLLAGIVLVDLLAVAGMSGLWAGLFVFWFALALLLQRFIPAT